MLGTAQPQLVICFSSELSFSFIPEHRGNMDSQDHLAMPECLEVEDNFSDLFPNEFDNSFSDRQEPIAICRNREDTSYSSSPRSSPESNVSPSSSGYYTESSNDGSDKLNVKKRKYTEVGENEIDSDMQVRLSSDTKQMQDTIIIPQVKQEFKKPRFRIQPGCSKSEFASAQAANPELKDDIQQGRVLIQQPTLVNAKFTNTANSRLSQVKPSEVQNTQQEPELVFFVTPLEETSPSCEPVMHSTNHTNLTNTPPAPYKLKIGLGQHHAAKLTDEHQVSHEGMIGPVAFSREQALQKQKVTQGKLPSRMSPYTCVATPRNTPPLLRTVGGFPSATPGGAVRPGSAGFVSYPFQQQHRPGHPPSIPQPLPWGGSYHAYLQQQYAANIQYRQSQLQQPQQVWSSSQPSFSPYFDGSLLGRSNRVKEAHGVLHDPTNEDWVKAQHLKYLRYHLELYNFSRKM